MSDDITWNGLWEGFYAYSSSDLGKFPFKLRLSVKDGNVRGITIEDGEDHGETRKGEIEGTIDDRKIVFVKTYKVDGATYGRPIRYEGEINAMGDAISGAWFLPDDQGSFMMKRAG